MAISVANIIRIAKASQYLALLDVQKGSLFGRRISPQTPMILYMERKAVEWLYDLDPTNETLTATANYLYSLCRGYNLQAQNITGGGGTVAPVTPTTAPEPYDFEVDATSFIPTGGTTKIITTFLNYNLLFVRNGIPQSTLNIGGNSYYSWDRETATLVISPAAVAGESFQLYPV